MGSIDFTLYPDLKVVHFKGNGKISYNMIIEKIIELHKHQDWRFDFNTFIDFEDAEVSAEVETVKKYNRFFDGLQQSTPIRKWAIFTRNSQTHNNANMSHLLQSKNIKVDVFHYREDALKFLGISPKQFEKHS